jgi:hypothetical protein
VIQLPCVGFTLYTLFIAFLPCLCYEWVFPAFFPAPERLHPLNTLIGYYLFQCQLEPLPLGLVSWTDSDVAQDAANRN